MSDDICRPCLIELLIHSACFMFISHCEWACGKVWFDFQLDVFVVATMNDCAIFISHKFINYTMIDGVNRLWWN